MEWSQWFVLSWIQFAVSSLLILVISTIALRWISQTVERARLIHASFLLLTALPFLSFITIVPAWRIDVNAWLASISSDDPTLVRTVPIVGQVSTSRESLHASILDRKTAAVRSDERQTAATEATPELNATTSSSGVPRSLLTDQEQTPTGAPVNPWALSFAGIIGLQFVGCVWFMVVALLGWIQLRRILRNSTIASANVLERWSHVSHGRGSTVKILESESITTPMTFGCWAPIIVIPSKIGRHEVDDLDACLAHEWAHIQHKDPWIFTWANLLRIIYWYQPWVHMLCRELRVCQELIADRSVVRNVAEPIQYSELLMRLSAARSCPIPSGALTMVRPTSQLSRRILALLEPDSMTRTRCNYRFNVCIGLAILLLLLCSNAIRVNQAEANEPTVEQAGAVPKGLRAVTYVRKVVPRDNTKSPRNYRETVVQDGRYRSEALMADQSSAITSISNGSESITILYDVKRYTKPGIERGELLPPTWMHLENLKNARVQATEQFDAKEIDGKKSTGFTIQQFQRNYKVWIDKASEELVQIEFDDFFGNHVTMNHFQLEQKVDGSVFLCDIPEGFGSINGSTFASILKMVSQALFSRDAIQSTQKLTGASKVWERRSNMYGILAGNGDWFWNLGYQQIDAIDSNNVKRFSFAVDADHLACVDIDRDGTNEIVAYKNVPKAGSAYDVASRRISLFNSRGESMWTYEKPVPLKREFFETVITADLHGDAKSEVIISNPIIGLSRLPLGSIALDSAGNLIRSRLLEQEFVDICPLKNDGKNETEHVVITKEKKLQIVGRTAQEPREIAPAFEAYAVRVYESTDGKSEQMLAVGFHPSSKVSDKMAAHPRAVSQSGSLILASLDRDGEIHWEAKLKSPPGDLSICPNKPWVAVVQSEVVQVIDLSNGKEIASVPGRSFGTGKAAWVTGADGSPLLILKSRTFDQEMLTAYRIDE
jgi:beta-lactamase regulating signal transducer with metallopeptidase domain